MELTSNLQIVCPIRGVLRVNKKSKDGLLASEEFYRVEAINIYFPRDIQKRTSGLNRL